jgi:rhodanese-related sulfurtransferase
VVSAGQTLRKTENYFTQRGPQALLLAKFIPGLGTVAAPIAGQSGMLYGNFLLYDMAGATLWAVAVALTGRFFGDVLKRQPQIFSWVDHFAGILLVLAVIGILGYRIWKQRKFRSEVRTARLTPDELKAMLDAGKKVFIVDLRHPLDYLPDPRVLPGAIRISPDNLVARKAEIPSGRDVVLYCTCPSEATAVKTALKLRRVGVQRVRPLQGGFDEWKKLGYPLEDYPEDAVRVPAESKPVAQGEAS